MSLDRATLRSLAGMTDEIGILSVYVTLDPHRRAEDAAKPSWELRMRSQLSEVRDRLKQQGPREHYMAFAERLEQLRLDLERLLDPATPGQGRAMFTGIADGEVREVSLQVPLVDLVALQPRAHLGPLVAAWSGAGPAGAVAVSADEVRIVDLRFGWTEELAVIKHGGQSEQRELKGPAAANPALPQHSAPQHDLFERREEDKLLRYLRTVGPRVVEHAKQQGWEHTVLTGEAPLVQAVIDGLPQPWPEEVLTLPHPATTLTRPKLAATVEPALEQARRERRRDLARRAREAAMAASTGAVGLGETLDALQQGRVAHLLLTAERQWAGSGTADGRLVPEGEVPPGVEAADLIPEPDLGERMIDLAFQESADITVLEPSDAEPLADVDGIGALLRW